MDKHTTLDNGLRIVTHAMAGHKSAAVGIWITIGGRYETKENKGISHFLEHLLFKGTKKYSCRQIKESVEGAGGMLNAFTAEEATCYLAKIPARHLEDTLAILSDMALNPLLNQDDIDKERTVILEEIKMYKDQPQHYVYDILDNLLWPGQPLGLAVIGSAESVGAMTREDIAGFKVRAYSAPNIIIAAAGALSHAAFVRAIAAKFRRAKKADTNTFVPVSETQGAPQTDILAKETEQTHLALGFHTFKRDHPLKHALTLLHIILGANMSSRLFNTVREERGLAYEIGTQVKRYVDTGAFIVHAGIDNHKVPQAVELITQELAKTTRDLVTIDEFKRAKEFYLGQLTLALEDTMDYMLWMGERMVTLGRTQALADIIREVSRVRREDIRTAARQTFKGTSINCALIGPAQLNRDAIHQLLLIP